MTISKQTTCKHCGATLVGDEQDECSNNLSLCMWGAINRGAATADNRLATEALLELSKLSDRWLNRDVVIERSLPSDVRALLGAPADESDNADAALTGDDLFSRGVRTSSALW